MMKEKLIIIGAGGHAKVLIDLIQLLGCYEILGIVDADQKKWGVDILGIKIIGGDAEILKYSPDQVKLVNALGLVDRNQNRAKIFEKFSNLKYKFSTLCHPKTIISSHVIVQEGAQIMAGAVIQASANIGKNSIINTGASVDHDSVIGGHVHVAPGAIICGNVSVGNNTLIGLGAVVNGCCKVGEDCIVGAGAVVIHNVPSCQTVVGVPASAIVK